jgi:hypothetical protein
VAGALITASPVTLANLEQLYSGTYTPTITTGVNCDSAVNNGIWKYLVVNNIVQVFGQVQIDATSAGTVCKARATLPRTTDITTTSQLAGTMHTLTGSTVKESGSIIGDITNEAVEFQYVPTSTALVTFSFTFAYAV